MIRTSRLLGIVLCLPVGLSVAGCQSDSKSAGSLPTHATGVGSTGSIGPVNASPSVDATAKWHPALTVKADTLYLGRGQLPVPEVDRTTASGNGDLLVKVQCDRGQFDPLITVDGNDLRVRVSCTGGVRQQVIAPVRKGSAIAIRPEGDDGTNFALELSITKAPVRP